MQVQELIDQLQKAITEGKVKPSSLVKIQIAVTEEQTKAVSISIIKFTADIKGSELVLVGY